jgi:hypothetical protein
MGVYNVHIHERELRAYQLFNLLGNGNQGGKGLEEGKKKTFTLLHKLIESKGSATIRATQWIINASYTMKDNDFFI